MHRERSNRSIRNVVVERKLLSSNRDGEGVVVDQTNALEGLGCAVVELSISNIAVTVCRYVLSIQCVVFRRSVEQNGEDIVFRGNRGLFLIVPFQIVAEFDGECFGTVFVLFGFNGFCNKFVNREFAFFSVGDRSTTEDQSTDGGILRTIRPAVKHVSV